MKNTISTIRFGLFLFILSIYNLSFSQELPSLAGSEICSFIVGTNSPNSGTYIVNAEEEEAYAYNDFENEQFVIEISGNNFIDLMLIIEKPIPGKHPFTMEMQVLIEISKNNGDDYFSFDNYQEEGGGFIQIDRIDKIDENESRVTGSFSGFFNDSSTENDVPVQIDGKFSVKRM